MFNLEQELSRFLHLLGDKRLVSRSCLDEVEAHLLDEIDDLVANGFAEEEAFKKATKAFGTSSDLLNEYSKLFSGSRRGQLVNLLSHFFDRRVVMKILVGLVLGGVFMLASLLLEGGHVRSILQATAFILVSGMAVGLSLLNSTWGQLRGAYSNALRGKRAEAGIFRLVGRNFLNSGLVGASVGFVHTLANLALPEKIGPGVAMSVMSLLYGFLGYLIFGLGFEASVAESETKNKTVKIFPGFLKLGVPMILIALAFFGAPSFSLGAIKAKNYLNASGILAVCSGILIVASFARNLGKIHLPYLANGALGAGVVGFIFNFHHVLENLDKPGQIFVGLSVAFLPMLYAVVIAMILRAASDQVMSDQNGGTVPLAIATVQVGQKPQAMLAYYVASIGFLVVSMSLILYALAIYPT